MDSLPPSRSTSVNRAIEELAYRRASTLEAELCSRYCSTRVSWKGGLQYCITLHTVHGHSLIGCIAAIGKTALTHLSC